MRQIEIHKKIDDILAGLPEAANPPDITRLISENSDSRQYFYSRANESWFDWLHTNGFLKTISEETPEPIALRQELQYLSRVAEKVPAKVADLVLSLKSTDRPLNREVIDRILSLAKGLPANHLSRIVNKMLIEKWLPLMGQSNQWYDYEEMFKVLVAARDFSSVLLLAEAILTVRSKEELESDSLRLRRDNPFYFAEVAETRVFESLLNLPADSNEKALALATKVMTKVVLSTAKATGGDGFIQEEHFGFYDVDFFTLESGKYRGPSHREEIVELAALVTGLAKKLLKSATHPVFAKRIYTQHISTLPESTAMWRLRLSILAITPEIFKDELKTILFKIFDSTDYLRIIYGSEYKTALKKCFIEFSDNDKKDYVAKVITLFSEGPEHEDITQGSRILSVILDWISGEEQDRIKALGFTLHPGYMPQPTIGKATGGFVSPRAPIDLNQFGNLAISEIANNLKTVWAPEKLKAQNKPEDFLSPISADGIADTLKQDFSKRFQEYLNNASLFFDREALDPHYTYAFFNAIRETLREGKSNYSNTNWDALLTLFSTIEDSASRTPFAPKNTRADDSTRLVGWQSVHSAMAEVLQAILSEKNGKIYIPFSQARLQLLKSITYLLNYPDPTEEDEKRETAKIRVNSPETSDYLVSDPLTTAINSVRGKTFEAFLYFIYQDGKKFTKATPVKIDADAKDLYARVLGQENTRALMFMFAHHLASFYFRDKAWISLLLPQIFPEQEDKKHLYLAAWEGHLTSSLYGEMFFDPYFQKLYERGIDLTGDEDPGRKYFKNPDEGISVHFALAFAHFKDFGFEHPLFKKFWTNGAPVQHLMFVSFLGRAFISGEDSKNIKLLEKQEVSERFEKFWNWLLETYTDPTPFPGFGFWINVERPAFKASWLAPHLKRTLTRTKGVIDWDYALAHAIQTLAKEAPIETLEIARLFFLEGGVKNKEKKQSFHWEDKCYETLKTLYETPSTKDGAYALIDDLIREGGSLFWKLKDILKTENIH